ncbi:linear element protein Mug20 [Schizosaccharomyces osmophilus]|uniref:Linear element protein Mug20 n=1 Tax=Schizosaccharomyces osmophilus TaxID=2545709 RepID=A0AAF0AVG6_9SCHI|nr:linear element protein Mug20 [Schizosaccharomyces osmophilus]WBW73546.1 linear element protein Mug20 [Schizosaccharomyces osmophilus]
MSNLVNYLQTELSNRHATFVSQAVLSFNKHHDRVLQSYIIEGQAKETILQHYQNNQSKLQSIQKLYQDASKTLSLLLSEYEQVSTKIQEIDTEEEKLSQENCTVLDLQERVDCFQVSVRNHCKASQEKLKRAMEKLKSSENSAQKALLENL